MGIFGPKLTDVDYYSSVVMTYGQAIDAIESSEFIDQHRAIELHGYLLTIAAAQIETMSGESYFTHMYAHHLAGAVVRGDSDQVQFFLLNNNELITQMVSGLTTAFSSPVSRDEALLIGVKHVDRLSTNLRKSNFQSDIQECGYCIGLAMKTIMDDDLGSKAKIASKRVAMGALAAAKWSAVVLASPNFV